MGRNDLLAPATGHPETVRNEQGQIVSVPGFVIMENKELMQVLQELKAEIEELKADIQELVDNYLFSPVFRIIDRKIKYFRDTRLRGSDAHWKSKDSKLDEKDRRKNDQK